MSDHNLHIENVRDELDVAISVLVDEFNSAKAEDKPDLAIKHDYLMAARRKLRLAMSIG